MSKSKLVRIDTDVMEEIVKSARKNDRSVPKEVNRRLRKSLKESKG